MRHNRRRRPAHRDTAAPQKGSRQEPLFFGEVTPAPFFQPTVQRQCADCGKEDKVQRTADKTEEQKVQKKEAAHTTSTAGTAANFVGSLHSKGQPMGKATRSFYEGRMGNNFAQVRIHTDGEAARSAKDINAQAYTYGNHIVFGEGQYRPETSSGRHLLAHELAHVVQQGLPTGQVGGAGPQVQRQVAPAAPVPHFRDCVRSITGRDDADTILHAAINRARDFVNTAIARLANAPVPGSVYETALALHFGNPISDNARAALRRVYQHILRSLVAPNFMCNTMRVCNRGDQAFWEPSDDLIHICPQFWIEDATCQAITLIHEGAHDGGIDLDDEATPVEEPHSPNRGRGNYPVAGAPRRGRVSRGRRANTPDAYAFFAAHVHTGADVPGDCFH